MCLLFNANLNDMGTDLMQSWIGRLFSALAIYCGFLNKKPHGFIKVCCVSGNRERKTKKRRKKKKVCAFVCCTKEEAER